MGGMDFDAMFFWKFPVPRDTFSLGGVLFLAAGDGTRECIVGVCEVVVVRRMGVSRLQMWHNGR